MLLHCSNLLSGTGPVPDADNKLSALPFPAHSGNGFGNRPNRWAVSCINLAPLKAVLTSLTTNGTHSVPPDRNPFALMERSLS